MHLCLAATQSSSSFSCKHKTYSGGFKPPQNTGIMKIAIRRSWSINWARYVHHVCHITLILTIYVWSLNFTVYRKPQFESFENPKYLPWWIVILRVSVQLNCFTSFRRSLTIQTNQKNGLKAHEIWYTDLRNKANRVSCVARILEVFCLILIAKDSWQCKECVWIKMEAWNMLEDGFRFVTFLLKKLKWLMLYECF